MLVIDYWGIACETALDLLSLDVMGDKSTLGQIRAWYHYIFYLDLCRNLGIRIQWVKALGPGDTYVRQWTRSSLHDDVIKWRHFPRYWIFVRGIHRSPVNSPHKGQWSVSFDVFFICIWINGWINNRKAGDLRRHRAHYDVTLMGLGNSLATVLTFSVLLAPFAWGIGHSPREAVVYMYM